MTEVTVKNIIRRANFKLRKDGSRICTSRGWRARANIGRWHLVDDTNTVRDYWFTLDQLEFWAREFGVLFHADRLTEN